MQASNGRVQLAFYYIANWWTGAPVWNQAEPCWALIVAMMFTSYLRNWLPLSDLDVQVMP